jgi:hypothetical protein
MEVLIVSVRGFALAGLLVTVFGTEDKGVVAPPMTFSAVSFSEWVLTFPKPLGGDGGSRVGVEVNATRSEVGIFPKEMVALLNTKLEGFPLKSVAATPGRFALKAPDKVVPEGLAFVTPFGEFTGAIRLRSTIFVIVKASALWADRLRPTIARAAAAPLRNVEFVKVLVMVKNEIGIRIN